MRRVELTFLIGVAALASVILPLTAQITPKPAFQAASVKANANSGFSPTTLRIAGNRFITTGMPLRPLIMQFYNLRDFQIVGGPDWINMDQWDIEGVADESINLQTVDLLNPNRPTTASLMVQSLLQDRFQFKSHRETKVLPVYELTVARNGPKLKLSAEQNPVNRRVTRGEIDIQAYPFATFAYLLARQLDHLLIDKTNLTGSYDIKLQWNAELTSSVDQSFSDRPSVFTALQDQLGLKLEATKGPVEILVIDSVQKPTQN
jgi:uncharacterized protein (TIGR03435 family)